MQEIKFAFTCTFSSLLRFESPLLQKRLSLFVWEIHKKNLPRFYFTLYCQNNLNLICNILPIQVWNLFKEIYCNMGPILMTWSPGRRHFLNTSVASGAGRWYLSYICLNRRSDVNCFFPNEAEKEVLSLHAWSQLWRVE